MKQDHEAVRTLAIQIGVRPAARQLGLNEDRVRKWSEREKWFTLPPDTQNATVTTVTKPGDIALSELHSDISKSRTKLARLTHDSIEDAQPVKVKTAQDLKNIAATIQQLGPGWEAKSETRRM